MILDMEYAEWLGVAKTDDEQHWFGSCSKKIHIEIWYKSEQNMYILDNIMNTEDGFQLVVNQMFISWSCCLTSYDQCHNIQLCELIGHI